MRFAAIATLVLVLSGCSSGVRSAGANVSAGPVAHATIQPLAGSGVTGTVTFTQEYPGTNVRYNITGLPPGPHGFHVHAQGSCANGEDGTPGGAAGGHFDPFNTMHGSPDATRDRRHVGDFGNIVANASGTASGVLKDGLIEFEGPNAITGLALIIHVQRDDLTSQPTGDSGDRVGCGIVVAGG